MRIVATFGLLAISSCLNEAGNGTDTGVTEQQCKDTPSICDNKCVVPPILVELHDETTNLGVADVTVSGPLTKDGAAFTDAGFVGVCKVTTDNKKTLCTVNERKNYIGVAVYGKFTFKVTAPGYKTLTLTANVPANKDCCCPFLGATESFTIPKK